MENDPEKGLAERPEPTTKCPTERPPQPPTEMDNWIKELEENAKIFTNYKKGDLYCQDPHVLFDAKSGEIELGDYFKIHQLEAIVKHMKKYNKEGQ